MSKAKCHIRPYQLKDHPHILQLLKKNIPKYFAPSELDDLVDYLEKEREDYFVLEQEKQLLGAGGINYFSEEKKARISWDFLDPAAQGQGLGTQLLAFRVDHVRKQKTFELIEVRTSQLVYPFYEKGGFQVQKIIKDYWAVGYDLYQMEMRIGEAT